MSCPHAPDAVPDERTFTAPVAPYPGEVVVEGGEIPVLRLKIGRKARILKMLFNFYRKIMLSFVDPDISRQSGPSLSVAADG